MCLKFHLDDALSLALIYTLWCTSPAVLPTFPCNRRDTDIPIWWCMYARSVCLSFTLDYTYGRQTFCQTIRACHFFGTAIFAHMHVHSQTTHHYAWFGSSQRWFRHVYRFLLVLCIPCAIWLPSSHEYHHTYTRGSRPYRCVCWMPISILSVCGACF